MTELSYPLCGQSPCVCHNCGVPLSPIRDCKGLQREANQHASAKAETLTTLYGDRSDGWIVEKDMGDVTCLDCGWQGKGYQLAAQACPVCDGRCADC